MAGHDDGEDFFSDDDLDDLPKNALDELEEDAIRQTQATQLIKAPPSSNYGEDFDDDDLDDDEVFDAAQGGPAGEGLAQPILLDSTVHETNTPYRGQSGMKSITGRLLKKEWPLGNHAVQHRPPPRLPQNMLGNRHQDGLPEPLAISKHTGPPNISMQRVQTVDQKYMVGSQEVRGRLATVQPTRLVALVGTGNASLQQRPAVVEQVCESIDGLQTDAKTEPLHSSLVGLQKQLDEARQQQVALRQELNLRAGEISIVRIKQEKAAKEFERELTATRKLHAERTAQQQRELDLAKDAQKTTATELEFLKRDLVEESEKVRTLKRAKDKGGANNDELASTPSKTRAYRDGFDDDEIMIISPSKFQGKKSNPSTPSKGAKRKRKAPDSPSIPLELSHDGTLQEKLSLSATAIIDDAVLEQLRKPDDRLNFLELVFDHRPHRDQLRTLEAFASLSFPSTSNESFASMVLGKLSVMNQKKSSSEFAIEFCELIISLWSRCLVEKYYKPIHLLVDLVTFALELKTTAIAPYVIDSLLPVAQLTCDIVAIPRFKREPCTEFENVIDASACLAVIYLAALGCKTDQEHTIRFWRFMRLDFVLMMLSQHQPPNDFDMTLQLLSISTMKDSIGPKALDQEEQQQQAGYIIDRISLLLTSLPTVQEDLTKHDPSVISNLRLQILRSFDAFCQTEWGTEALALHKYAIGRLVKLMSDELDALYDYRSEHRQNARIICLTIRLLHHLVTTHDKVINMQKKLSEILGGNQKYLICLARLNFSEDDLVLDADIDPEIAECAHELLELAVTPEEGDAIHSAFSSQ